MKRLLLISSIALLLPFINEQDSGCYAQGVGVNSTGASPSTSAGLDVNFTDKGILIPRVELTSTASASPVSTPDTSLLVYNTATAGDVTPGFYFWDGTKWNRFSTGSVSAPPCYLCDGF